MLVGESHQIDLVLPAAVPLAALAEPTRDAVNRDLRSAAPRNCRTALTFSPARSGMTALAGDVSLAAQGISDADLLAFVPAAAGAALRTQHRKRLHRDSPMGQEHHFPPVIGAATPRWSRWR